MPSGEMSEGEAASGLRVRLGEASDAGRLYPRYVEGARLIAVESRVQRELPFGINIDSTLIFDLDADRVVAHFDVLIRRANWSHDPALRWPTAARTGSLIFEEAVRAEEFGIPVAAASDPSGQLLEIHIGSVRADEAWALSDSCIALTRDSELAGLVIKFSGGE